MAVKCKLPIKIYNIEGRFSIRIKRYRKEIMNILKVIDNGTKLEQFFPQTVADSLLKQFIEKGFIDSSQKLQDKGREFINDPYYDDEETSVYSIDYTNLTFGDNNFNLLLKLNRKLANEDLPIGTFDLDVIRFGNEIRIGEDEVVIVDAITNKTKKVYRGKNRDNKMEIDLSTAKYSAGYGFLKLNSHLSSIIIPSAIKIFTEEFPFLKPTDDFNALIINNLEDISMEQLLAGTYSKNTNNFEISNHPIVLNDLRVAKQYAYYYIYDLLLNKGQYLSIDDMNDIFQNEIMTKDIYTDEVKKQLSNFTISRDGFSNFLSKNKYEQLSYKLNVMKLLLDYELNSNRISGVRNYNELANYFKKEINYKDLKNIYMIMGYPFVKNKLKPNMIIDCVDVFQSELCENITIIRKGDGGNQKEDSDIRQDLLSKGVKVCESSDIKDVFHDRFILFESKTGIKVYMISCEIGQFFHKITQEPCGYITPMDPDQIQRGGKSLVQMVKGVK